jgi:hypothetical protein
MSGRQPCLTASSVMYFSIEPMVTAPRPSFSVQAPSHRRSCGQTRPQTSGSELVRGTVPRPRTGCLPRSASASSGCSCAPGTSTRSRDYRNRGSVPPGRLRPRRRTGRRFRGNHGALLLRGLARVLARISRNCRCLLAIGSCVAQAARLAQGFDQALQVRRLGLHQPELRQVAAEVVQICGPTRCRFRARAPRSAAQVVQVRSMSLGRDAVDVDQLVVVAIHEVALQCPARRRSRR